MKTKNGFVITNEIKKRFCRDTKLNFPLFEDDYFYYYIELYNNLFQSKDKFEEFLKMLENFNSSEDFLTYYIEIKDKIISDVTKKSSYNEFINTDMKKFETDINFSKKDIFNLANVNKLFLSIDLKKANFQSLNYFNKNILDADSYHKFISKYTPYSYMQKSKHMREVVFGELNPKRQVKIERYIISVLLKNILDNTNILFKNIYLNNDEIIFEIINEQNIKMNISNIKTISKNMNIDVSIEFYKLKQIGTKNKWFIKEFLNKDGFDIVVVPKLFMPQVIKYLENKPIEERDLGFHYESLPAHFDSPIEI